jgi:DNA-binding response OmpR family regulator
MPDKKTSRVKEPTSKRNHLNPPQRILVVDDDEDIRLLNVEILTNSGYTVDTAADGAIAWDALQLNDYDLLLTDYNMPKVNGLNLIKKLRAACVAMPVILASGTIPTKEVRHPWVYIDATLPKPHTSDELLATVRKVLHEPDGIAGKPMPLPNGQYQLGVDGVQPRATQPSNNYET